MARRMRESRKPDNECNAPQAERYPGSDVLGMEETNARPLKWATGADPDIPLPGKPWPHSLSWPATARGKRVMI